LRLNWEAVVLLRRALLAVFGVAFGEPAVALLGAVAALSGSVLLQMWVKPYAQRRLNLLQVLAVCCMQVALLLCLLHYRVMSAARLAAGTVAAAEALREQSGAPANTSALNPNSPSFAHVELDAAALAIESGVAAGMVALCVLVAGGFALVLLREFCVRVANRLHASLATAQTDGAEDWESDEDGSELPERSTFGASTNPKRPDSEIMEAALHRHGSRMSARSSTTSVTGVLLRHGSSRGIGKTLAAAASHALFGSSMRGLDDSPLQHE
jgi:hypothetical protein